MSRTKIQSVILRTIVYLAAILTAAALLILLLFIFIKGIPHLSLDLFKLEYNSENVSLLPAMINTVTMTLMSLAAFTLELGAAVYLQIFREPAV